MSLPHQPLTWPARGAVPARAKVLPDLEAELQRALEEIERGEYVELTSEQLQQWADSGVAPWPEESPG